MNSKAEMTREELLEWRCRPLGRSAALAPTQTDAQLEVLPGWQREGDWLAREFRFSTYRDTVDFVNAVAAIAEEQDHHPELHVSYDRCLVRWSTHSAGGPTVNDFACAAMTDAAYERGAH